MGLEVRSDRTDPLNDLTLVKGELIKSKEDTRFWQIAFWIEAAVTAAGLIALLIR